MKKAHETALNPKEGTYAIKVKVNAYHFFEVLFQLLYLVRKELMFQVQGKWLSITAHQNRRFRVRY